MADMNCVFGIVGWKNSGKTTLVTELVRALRERNLTVSTVKHAHHGFDIDKPGKDSFLHREAGAAEVMIASDRRWALMTEHGGPDRPPLADLVAHMSPVDVIIAEGFKAEPHPKLEVRRDHDKPLLAAEDSSVCAVVTDDPGALRDCPCPVLARGELSSIIELVLRAGGRR